MAEHADLPAGNFSAWLAEMQGALRGERGSDVPCGDCTACCTSSQFVHVGPDETDTLAHIPSELLFAAPRLPAGHVLLGYDERGHCPMLVDNRCSIYEHRPNACRTYDCRIFPGAGITLGDDDKALIDRRARRWRFSFPTEADRVDHKAVQAAAAFLTGNGEVLPNGAALPNATGLAILAIQIHQAFLQRDAESGQMTIIDPDPAAVRVELTRRTDRPSSEAPVRRRRRFRTR
jgi:Fe-S-cluster containining protein